MDISVNFIRWFTGATGALVLASYAYGISRFESPKQLWGGVSPELQKLIVPFMFVAAAGFLTFFIFVAFINDASVMANLRWPWGESDGMGNQRLLFALALFLIPSIFWLEATLLHINSPAAWTQILTIGVLVLAGIGTILLILLSYGAWQDGVKGGLWMFLGAIAIAIQCAINDAVIWVWKFPW